MMLWFVHKGSDRHTLCILRIDGMLVTNVFIVSEENTYLRILEPPMLPDKIGFHGIWFRLY